MEDKPTTEVTVDTFESLGTVKVIAGSHHPDGPKPFVQPAAGSKSLLKSGATPMPRQGSVQKK